MSWLNSLDKLLVATSSASPPPNDGPYRSNYNAGLATWKQIGGMLELNEDSIRRRRASLRSSGLGAPPGCAWLRCPLHGNETVAPRREMMLCVGCRQVSQQHSHPDPLWHTFSVQVEYCGSHCQRLCVSWHFFFAYMLLITCALQGLG